MKFEKLKGLNSFGTEVDRDQFLADLEAKIKSMVSFEFLTTREAPGYLFLDYPRPASEETEEVLTEYGGPGFIMNAGIGPCDSGYPVGDTSEVNEDFFREHFFVEVGSREYLDRKKDEIKEFFQLGYGQEQAIMEHLYPSPRRFGIRFREIAAGKIPRFGIFLWQNSFYVVEGDVDSDYRFLAGRIASGWTMNPYDRWQRAEGTDVFNGYCMVQELLFVQGEE